MKSSGDSTQAISSLIFKLCSLERSIEIKRQKLCNFEDFEPYAAFSRIARNQTAGITKEALSKFMKENHVDTSPNDCNELLVRYDIDKDGLISYREFLGVVLPKEHPDLRAFVTQRDCINLKQEEFFGYETELTLVELVQMELKVPGLIIEEIEELTKLGIGSYELIKKISGSPAGRLDYNNLHAYLTNAGYLPYDAEIISFLKRVDRTDDGTVSVEELSPLFGSKGTKFNRSGSPNQPNTRERLRELSPGRKVVSSNIVMISPSRGERIVYDKDGTSTKEQWMMKLGYTVPKGKIEMIKQSGMISPSESRRRVIIEHREVLQPIQQMNGSTSTRKIYLEGTRDVLQAREEITILSPRKEIISNQEYAIEQIRSQIDRYSIRRGPLNSRLSSTGIQNRSSLNRAQYNPKLPLQIFIDQLRQIANKQAKLDSIREKLIDSKEFSFSELLNLIDQDKKGKFSFDQLRSFITNIGVSNCDTRAMIDLYSSLDSNPNCLLSIAELRDIIAPGSDIIEENIDQLKDCHLSQEILGIIRNCFEEVFALRSTLQACKRSLKDCGAELHTLFDLIDIGKKGFLELSDFKAAVGDKHTQTSINSLFLMTDLDHDGKINFKDFYMFFSA